MSILIKGMEMPTRCAECWLMDGEDSWCTACRGRHLGPEYRYGIKDRPGWCPLVPVPPHGRLGDLAELKAKQQEDADLFINAVSLVEKSRRDEALNAVANIVNAPTIIPAESITSEKEKNDK